MIGCITPIILRRTLVLHYVLSCGLITTSQNFFIKLMLFYNLSYYASSMLSDTYYAQNYAGIIGMGLEVISSYIHGTVGQGMSEPINYY